MNFGAEWNALTDTQLTSYFMDRQETLQHMVPKSLMNPMYRLCLQRRDVAFEIMCCRNLQRPVQVVLGTFRLPKGVIQYGIIAAYYVAHDVDLGALLMRTGQVSSDNLRG